MKLEYFKDSYAKEKGFSCWEIFVIKSSKKEIINAFHVINEKCIKENVKRTLTDLNEVLEEKKPRSPKEYFDMGTFSGLNYAQTKIKKIINENETVK